MTYRTKVHQKGDYQVGDLILLRNSNSQSWIDKLFIAVQRMIPDCSQGHKNSSHMMVVVEAGEGDALPKVAHIDYEDPNTLNKHYSDKKVRGLPIIEELPIKYSSQPHLLIRPNDPNLAREIGIQGKFLVEHHRAQRTEWAIVGAIKALIRACRKDHQYTDEQEEYAKTQLICTQFVSTIMRSACKAAEVKQEEYFNISTESALPKVIEHTLKTQHVYKYEFQIAVAAQISLFTRAVDILNDMIPHNLSTRLEEIINAIENSGYSQVNPTDSGRILLKIMKSEMSAKEWKPIERELKARVGVFVEDIENIHFTDQGVDALNKVLMSLDENFSNCSDHPGMFALSEIKLQAKEVCDFGSKPIEIINRFKSQSDSYSAAFFTPSLDNKTLGITTHQPHIHKIEEILKDLSIQNRYINWQRNRRSGKQEQLAAIHRTVSEIELLKSSIQQNSPGVIENIDKLISNINDYMARLPAKGETKKLLQDSADALANIKQTYENTNNMSVSSIERNFT